MDIWSAACADRAEAEQGKAERAEAGRVWDLGF